MAKLELTRNILRLNKSFYNGHGFYPSMAWIALLVDCSRERVRQVFSNYREQRVQSFKFASRVYVGEIQIHPKMMLEIESIAKKSDITFREALKSWSYNKYKKDKK